MPRVTGSNIGTGPFRARRVMAVPAMVNSVTNVGRIASSTGIYGLRIGGGQVNSIAVRVRGKRLSAGGRY